MYSKKKEIKINYCCLELIVKAFFPNSNIKPIVNNTKNISITIKPYKLLT